LWLASIGTTVPTVNVSATALRFFFRVTLKRRDLAEEVVSTREPRRLPVVLSPEEVGRLLASATNIKHKALLSLAYATGLRASEVVSLKLTDIDSDRMIIRVEQARERRIGMSYSRPTFSSCCANGGAPRARSGRHGTHARPARGGGRCPTGRGPANAEAGWRRSLA
jgi:integrase